MKTLIYKDTGYYAVYREGQFYTSTIPTILSENATKELLLEYAKNFDNIDIGEKLKEIEIVEVTIVIDNYFENQKYKVN